MSDSTKNPALKKSEIQCIEILVSKKYLQDNRNNLQWTLSIYSLENQPVKIERSLRNSEVFHFMVYDWRKTIKQLLDKSQIPYSIIQYFSPRTIHADFLSSGSFRSDNEGDLISALEKLEAMEDSTVASLQFDSLASDAESKPIPATSR
jgi:hypothetical protein